MFNNNWRAYKLAEFMEDYSGVQNSNLTAGTTPLVLADGITDPWYGALSSFNAPTAGIFNLALATPLFIPMNDTTAWSYGVFFGSGNEKETVNDYALSGDVITNCTCSFTSSKSKSEDGLTGQQQYVYTITNNNADAITIGEVGVFTSVYGRKIDSTRRYYGLMVERTTLDNPITIQPGGVGQVTYTNIFDFSYV